MARIVTVNTGILRYIDSASPNVNNGGSKIKFGFWRKSETELQTFTMLCKFSVDEIAGGIPKNAQIQFYTEKINAEGVNRSSISGYCLENTLPIETCNLEDVRANGIDWVDNVGYAEITDYDDSISVGDIVVFDSTITTNEELNKEYAFNFLNYPLAIQTGISIYDSNNLVPPYGVMGEFAGFGSAKPPVLKITLDEAAISVGNATPASGFINKTIKNTFSWNIVYDAANVVGTIKPATAKFRWKAKNAVEYTEIAVTGASYSVPANTFSGDDIQWQVEVTTNAGTVATSEWYTVSTVDTAAIAVPTSPVNQKLNRDEVNVFKWNHTTEYGTEQTAADLEISVDGLNWQSLATVTGAEQSVIIPADTLPLGTVFWRVRTYNANNVVGAWSESAIIIVAGAVPVPEISSVLGGAKPVISWSVQTQQGYQAQIKDINDEIVADSFAQLGTNKSHIFNTLLDDGVYVARVRVYADNGNVSDWAQYSFTISTTKPQPPSLTVQSKEGCVVLTATAEAGNTVYILRDGVVIGRAKSNVFYDWTSSGQSKYIAREVNSQNAFADSKVVTASPIIYGSLLASANNPSEIVPLKYNFGGYPAREMAWSPMGGGAHYAGKNYPDYQFTQQSDESYNFSFAFKTRQEYERFMQLANSRDIILYRDQYGLKFYGVITGVSPSVQWSGWAITFSMTRVNYLEAIDYGG